ncbi:hypothetical protein GCM10011571_11170 [Marinithermofilum abyssi]|uniref:Uncharacterized protein n=1 Tax=Marinithermofilum abyssi TaxID=1571185 RepID=A0A8J2VEL3_9BACL|nr:hypothetical protein [Marinithermofilum abyssi]GGE11567.1 hypothetical protein GCM10011571_11170 [Marinithermofilum abyssi]
MSKRLSAVFLSVLMILTTSCTSKQEGSLQEQVKKMTQDMAMDSQVQRAFLQGRKETAESDGQLRREMFAQNLSEQKGMLNDSAIAPHLLDLNMDMTQRALNDNKMQERYLQTNLLTLKKIASDPAKRNQLLQTLQHARQDALNNHKMRLSLLKQGVLEHYDALNTPGITPMVLDYNMDVLERISTDPTQKKRLMTSQLATLKAIAKDPQLRPQLIAFMMELMKDPAMQKEMKKMMMPMLQMMKQQMQQQMKQKMMQQMKKGTGSSGEPHKKVRFSHP